ncbi:hypothetical protein Aduo_015656 [Ancylostoma duodenale]
MKDKEKTHESDDEEATTDHKGLDRYDGQLDGFTDDEEPDSPAKNTPEPVKGGLVKARRMHRVNLPPGSQRRAYAMPRGSYKTPQRRNNRRYRTRTGRKWQGTGSHRKNWRRMPAKRRRSISKGAHNF